MKIKSPIDKQQVILGGWFSGFNQRFESKRLE
jgi:hypothetical protein